MTKLTHKAAIDAANVILAAHAKVIANDVFVDGKFDMTKRKEIITRMVEEAGSTKGGAAVYLQTLHREGPFPIPTTPIWDRIVEVATAIRGLLAFAPACGGLQSMPELMIPHDMLEQRLQALCKERGMRDYQVWSMLP